MSALSGRHILSLRASSSPHTLDQTAGAPLAGFQKQDSLMARLARLGAICHHYPVIKIEAAGADNEQVKRQVMAFSEYDKAIIVSQHAARSAWYWLDRYWPMLPVGVGYFAVGPTSAQPMLEQGVLVSVPTSGYTSEALLALSALKTVEGQKILIFRGGQGRDLLEKTLRERGAKVDCCELYGRVVEACHSHSIVELIQAQSPLLLIYSGQILAALLEIVPEAHLSRLKNLPIVVPSVRVETLARGRGFRSIHLAASALVQDMEQSVLDCYTPAR
ncbi:MAG: uroporphyrinogen-III synthase [Porticoccaceae bacterium]|nr:uroporphyrinogen-III synthase [Porticoccaceae bacterium]